MITESTIYWITRLDGLKSGAEGFGMALVIIFVVALIFSCMARFADEIERATKFVITFSILSFLSGLLLFSSAFIPTTKEMCAIKIIPIVANDENIQEIPKKVVDLANEWIDELSLNKEDK